MSGGFYPLAPSLTEAGKATASCRDRGCETTDGNENWARVREEDDIGFRDMERDPTDDSIIYAVHGNNVDCTSLWGVYRSFNGNPGLWTRLNPPGQQRCHDISVVPYW